MHRSIDERQEDTAHEPPLPMLKWLGMLSRYFFFSLMIHV